MNKPRQDDPTMVLTPPATASNDGFVINSQAPATRVQALEQLRCIWSEQSAIDPDDFPGNDDEIDYLRSTVDRLIMIAGMLGSLDPMDPIFNYTMRPVVRLCDTRQLTVRTFRGSRIHDYH